MTGTATCAFTARRWLATSAAELAAQRRLVADHDAADHAGEAPHELHGRGDLGAVALRLAPEPDPEQDLEAVALGDLGHLVEALVGRIGAHAAGDRGEPFQILLDLGGGHAKGLVEGRLAAAERRIGDARVFLPGERR